jgi:hypothetical protein
MYDYMRRDLMNGMPEIVNKTLAESLTADLRKVGPLLLDSRGLAAYMRVVAGFDKEPGKTKKGVVVAFSYSRDLDTLALLVFNYNNRRRCGPSKTFSYDWAEMAASHERCSAATRRASVSDPRAHVPYKF